jgi:hypothetical protein
MIQRLDGLADMRALGALLVPPPVSQRASA